MVIMFDYVAHNLSPSSLPLLRIGILSFLKQTSNLYNNLKFHNINIILIKVNKFGTRKYYLYDDNKYNKSNKIYL